MESNNAPASELPLAEDARREFIENWLIQKIAALAGMEEGDIDLDRPFIDYRLDSSVAVTLTKDLEELLDVELSVTLFWEYPNIGALSEVLALA